MQQALSKMDEMLHALDNGTFLTTSVGDDLIANLCVFITALYATR